MKAKVIAIESGANEKDGERRIKIKFENADLFFSSVKISESALGISNIKLDDDLDVGFLLVREFTAVAGGKKK
jgi:hypothetical protein